MVSIGSTMSLINLSSSAVLLVTFDVMTLIHDALNAATDDTQRMMQMSGFGFDPSKV